MYIIPWSKIPALYLRFEVQLIEFENDDEIKLTELPESRSRSLTCRLRSGLYHQTQEFRRGKFDDP